MKLNCAFFLAVVCPIEYIEAESNNAGIKQHDAGCFDAFPEPAGEALLSQSLMKQSIDIPEHQGIALCILMAERVSGWSLLNSKVVKSTADSFQPFADIAQGLAVCHMAKQQGYEVRPSIESLAILVCMSLFCGKIDQCSTN